MNIILGIYTHIREDVMMWKQKPKKFSMRKVWNLWWRIVIFDSFALLLFLRLSISHQTATSSILSSKLKFVNSKMNKVHFLFFVWNVKQIARSILGRRSPLFAHMHFESKEKLIVCVCSNGLHIRSHSSHIRTRVTSYPIFLSNQWQSEFFFLAKIVISRINLNVHTLYTRSDSIERRWANSASPSFHLSSTRTFYYTILSRISLRRCLFSFVVDYEHFFGASYSSLLLTSFIRRQQPTTGTIDK